MRSQAQEPRQSIYETITAKILAAIEANPGDPIMPWQRGGARPVLPTNAVTGQDYRGVNILSLWVTALERGYGSGEWATLRQWNEKGACVRKGEKASPIVFYKEFDVTPEDGGGDGDNGNDMGNDTGRRRVARGYWVFAAEQVEGYAPATALPPNPIARIAAAQAYVAGAGARVIVGGAQACYRPSTDTIHMPDEARFFDTDGRTRAEAFHAVEFHELVHWAGARPRLDRQLGKRFGDDRYAAEEIIAETGSAFLCARVGIAPEPHPDHARYIHHWLSVMKGDSRAIFAAAAKAQEAVSYLDGLQSTIVQRSAA
jgi:antirestriction protein ArdC